MQHQVELAHAEPKQAIEALGCSARMKQALHLVADGAPYREAAHQMGFKDHRDLYRYAKSARLLEVHSERLVASYRRIASLANAELERRLVEEPETIDSKTLGIISGISADKAAKYEGWGASHQGQPGAGVAELLARLHAQGGGRIEVVTSNATQSVEVSAAASPDHQIGRN